MPGMVIRSVLPDDSEALELSIVGEEEGTNTVSIYVPSDCRALVITVTSTGDYGYQNGPINADFELVDTPLRRGRSEDYLIRGDNGQLIYVFDNPPRGNWPMKISHHANSDIEVNALALSDKWRNRLIGLGRGLRWLRCKACKFGLRALIIAIMIKLAPIIALHLGIAEFVDRALHIGDQILAVLKELLERVEGALKVFFEFLYYIIDDPIDKIIEKICLELGFCAQQPVVS